MNQFTQFANQLQQQANPMPRPQNQLQLPSQQPRAPYKPSATGFPAKRSLPPQLNVPQTSNMAGRYVPGPLVPIYNRNGSLRAYCAQDDNDGMQEESDGAGGSESSAYVAMEDHQALPIPSGFYFVDSNGFHNLG